MDARGTVPQDRQDEPHAEDRSNAPAMTSLVFGILAFVVQLLAGLVLVIQEHASDEAMKRLLAGKVTSVQSSGPRGDRGLVSPVPGRGHQRHRVRGERAKARAG
jgi:hypothetical protein